MQVAEEHSARLAAVRQVKLVAERPEVVVVVLRAALAAEDRAEVVVLHNRRSMRLRSSHDRTCLALRKARSPCFWGGEKLILRISGCSTKL